MKIPDSYSNLQTYAGKTQPCEPFELCRVVVGEFTTTATYRVVVVGKTGLGKEHGFADVPAAVFERLGGRDRLGVEQWIEVVDSSSWASMLATQVIRERAEFMAAFGPERGHVDYTRDGYGRKLRPLARIVSGRSDATLEDVVRDAEVVSKNLGLLLNNAGVTGKMLTSPPALIEIMAHLQQQVSRLAHLLQPEGGRLDLQDIETLLRQRSEPAQQPAVDAFTAGT